MAGTVRVNNRPTAGAETTQIENKEEAAAEVGKPITVFDPIQEAEDDLQKERDEQRAWELSRRPLPPPLRAVAFRVAHDKCHLWHKNDLVPLEEVVKALPNEAALKRLTDDLGALVPVYE